MQMRIPLFLLALFIIACQHRKIGVPPEYKNAAEQLADSVTDISVINDHFTTIRIPQRFSADNEIRLSEVIDSVWYLPLETNDSSIISYVDQVNEYKGNYIILDILSNKVLAFDKKGKFIRQIGHKGKGPGEYLHPTSFVVDTARDEIIVHDDHTSKIIHYDGQGNLKREEIAKYRFVQFVKSGDQYIINSDRSDNVHLDRILNSKLLFASGAWKVNHTAFGYDWETQQDLATNRRALIETDGHINYNPSYSYNIYRITDTSIRKTYFIDAGNYALPEGFDKNLSIEDFNRKYEKDNGNKLYISSAPLESNNHIVLTLNMNRQYIFAYYSKKTNKLFCNSYFNNDIPWCMGPANVVDVIGNTFVGYLNAVEVGEHRRDMEKYGLTKLLPPSFIAMTDAVKDIDNPVLAFFKLKDF
jgi:hypothetical protein